MFGMKTSEVLPLFNGAVRELADALGISVQAVYAWGDEVPRLRQYEIRDLIEKRKREAGGPARVAAGGGDGSAQEAA